MAAANPKCLDMAQNPTRGTDYFFHLPKCSKSVGLLSRCLVCWVCFGLPANAAHTCFVTSHSHRKLPMLLHTYILPVVSQSAGKAPKSVLSSKWSIDNLEKNKL